MEENIVKRIEKITSEIDKKSYKKYRVELLHRVALRLVSFEEEGCKTCEKLNLKLDTVVILLEAHIKDNTPIPKEYFKRLNMMMSHLRREHKLVEAGYYIAQFMVYGMFLGILIGNFYKGGAGTGLGVAFGMIAGIVIGSQVDRWAKKKSKVI